MKTKSIPLNKILSRELKKTEFRIIFDEHRFYLQVAHLISELRAKSGMSQTDLAKKANISQPMIARLEKGDRNRTPTFETIFKILKVLGYSMSINIQKEKKKAA